MTKLCYRCHQDKPMDQFNKQSAAKDGHQDFCRQCSAEMKWFYRYGITPEDYDEMLDTQDHKCAICGVSSEDYALRHKVHKRLVVDHDHSTDKVRGLLCNNCNIGLGGFDDDSARLRAGADYLDRVKI